MKNEEKKKEVDALKKDGKRHFKYGIGFGIASAGAVAVIGAAACPLCVVAVPGFIASSALKYRRAKALEENE